MKKVEIRITEKKTKTTGLVVSTESPNMDGNTKSPASGARKPGLTSPSNRFKLFRFSKTTTFSRRDPEGLTYG